MMTEKGKCFALQEDGKVFTGTIDGKVIMFSLDNDTRKSSNTVFLIYV